MGLEDLPRTIELSADGKVAYIVDQTRLPQDLIIEEIRSCERMIEAIERLEVRGAPALGIAGACALALYAKNQDNSTDTAEFLYGMEAVYSRVTDARPTAINLAWGTNQALEAAEYAALANAPVAVAKEAVADTARTLRDNDEAACRAIGAAGATLLPDNARVLTHCNAGSLACSFYGTALGMVYAAWELGHIEKVYIDETRPVGQGARLSAWELGRVGVPTTLICDSSAASLMAQGQIDAVVVGADRICTNGDTANKIGTYSLAVLAQHHEIPFYVAAPTSSIDFNLAKGSLIPIEERDGKEVAPNPPEGIEVYNPAFDVTPACLITNIITEKGVFTPREIRACRPTSTSFI